MDTAFPTAGAFVRANRTVALRAARCAGTRAPSHPGRDRQLSDADPGVRRLFQRSAGAARADLRAVGNPRKKRSGTVTTGTRPPSLSVFCAGWSLMKRACHCVSYAAPVLTEVRATVLA